MKQVTGSNPPADTQRVSVRIDSGGHSFSVDRMPRKAFDDATVVEMVIVTHKCTLVPAEIFEAADAAKYLAVAGLGCSHDEQPLHIVAGGKVAVAAVAASFIQTVENTFGQRAVFASPLLADYPADGRELHIRTMGSVSYIHLLKGGKLLFAEAVKTSDCDEILYYASMLDRLFGLDTYNIYMHGDRSSESAGLLKRYFRRVRCE